MYFGVCMERFKATLMDEAAITRALKRISHEILEKNNGCDNICIVGVKRRGVPLAQIIADNIYNIEGVKPPCAVLDITFYRDDLSNASPDPVFRPCDIPFSVSGKNVILVDDVLYTGRTARAAMEAIMSFGRAASIQFAVLVDRGHRELPIRGDYVGKNVPTAKSEFISVKIPPYDTLCSVEIYERE
jgi:pyrimidine operon attenuation protein/uracil phosphoribosyltransferase